jgi:hypothetical protein
MAMLITGDTVGFVAKQTGVPKQTVSRWGKDADKLLREVMRTSPELRAVAAGLRELLPGLSRPSRDFGTKKKARVR